jgi:hypothetical protein
MAAQTVHPVRSWGTDGLLVSLAIAHAVVLLLVPILPVIAVGVWWNSNTIAHNFIHRPFFRSRGANAMFAAGLSVLLGIPQSLWRDRHLAHHAGIPPRIRFSTAFCIQSALILSLWALIAWRAPVFFVSAYAPGYLLGLTLCALHGYYEHAHGATSYYGAVYNLLFLNDGYHVEHHAAPRLHWRGLPDRADPAARRSAWPAPFRWIEDCNLETLERLVFRSRILRSFVLRTHENALRGLLASVEPQRVGIVGGGLFPRTATIFRDLFPAAHLTIIDANRANLDCARDWLCAPSVEFRHERYTGGGNYDLLVLPLAFEGDPDAICARPPACGVVVHDWIWRERGAGRVVSLALLKRVYLVRP